MSFNLSNKAEAALADAEAEKRYQALVTKKERYEFLKSHKWERLRTVEKKEGDKTFWVVFWKQPDGKMEMTQSAAIRKQIRYNMIMAGEIVRTTGAR